MNSLDVLYGLMKRYRTAPASSLKGSLVSLRFRKDEKRPRAQRVRGTCFHVDISFSRMKRVGEQDKLFSGSRRELRNCHK